MIYKSRWQKKVEKNREWHDWFAWYPVTIMDNGDAKKVWLQTIERRWELIPGVLGYYSRYRVIKELRNE